MHVFPLPTLFFPSPFPLSPLPSPLPSPSPLSPPLSLPPPPSPLPSPMQFGHLMNKYLEPGVVAEQGFIYLKDYLLIFVLISIFNF